MEGGKELVLQGFAVWRCWVTPKEAMASHARQLALWGHTDIGICTITVYLHVFTLSETVY